MPITISELADLLGAEAVGDTSIRVVAPAEPDVAKADEIALAMNPKFLGLLEKGQAKTALLPQGADWQALGLDAAIFVGRARAALSTAAPIDTQEASPSTSRSVWVISCGSRN